MILQPEGRKDLDDIFAVAEKFLNQVVYIGWPHLVKAKIVGISNNEKYIDSDGIKDMDPRMFNLHVRAAKEQSVTHILLPKRFSLFNLFYYLIFSLFTRMGIEFPDLTVMVHAQTYLGLSYICGSQGKVTTNEIWSTTTTAYPAQGVVYDIAVNNMTTNQHKKIEQLFPENSRIFFVGNPYYGSEGVVMNPMLVYECGRLKGLMDINIKYICIYLF